MEEYILGVFNCGDFGNFGDGGDYGDDGDGGIIDERLSIFIVLFSSGLVHFFFEAAVCEELFFEGGYLLSQ